MLLVVCHWRYDDGIMAEVWRKTAKIRTKVETEVLHE